MFHIKYYDGNSYKEILPTNSVQSITIGGTCLVNRYPTLYVKYTQNDSSGLNIDVYGKLGDFITDLYTVNNISIASDGYSYYKLDLSPFEAYQLDISFGAPSVKSATDTIGTGDGVKLTFNSTLSNYPVPGTVTISYTIAAVSYTVTDDGNGGISDANVTGTIDYDTKVVNITFVTAPDAATDIITNYSIAGEAKIYLK